MTDPNCSSRRVDLSTLRPFYPSQPEHPREHCMASLKTCMLATNAISLYISRLTAPTKKD